MKIFITKKTLLLSLLSILSYCSFSQGVGIGTNTPDQSAALDITSVNKGLLVPRMNTPSVFAILNPAKGLLVYDSLTNQFMVNIGSPAVPNWLAVAANNGWNLSGNAAIDPVTQFVGTTDNQPLRFRVNNIQVGELHPANGNITWGLRANLLNTIGFSNIAIGTDALKQNTSRPNLVAIGDSALFNNGVGVVAADDATANTAVGSKSLRTNSIGSRNTAVGSEAMFSNTTGSVNTAFGGKALFSNTTGRFNAANGFASLFSNTSGESNTGDGFSSLFSNTTGHDNTATGNQSLASNTTGNSNTAAGSQALMANTTGGDNTSVGGGALRFNTTGNNNTAIGSLSMFNNTTGTDNTAVGVQSLNLNTTGNSNTAFGRQTLFNNSTGLGNTATGTATLFSNTTGGVNTADGNIALFNNTTGNNNTAVGVQALFLNTTGNSNTAVGGNALSATLTGTKNTALGFNAAFTVALGDDNTIIGAEADAFPGAKNCVAIGKGAKCTADNQIRFGNAATTSIGGFAGYTDLSDGRYKKNVQENVGGIDFILKLRPVTYQLDIAGINKRLDVDSKIENTATRSGFIAQEVEKAAKEAGYDFGGVDKPKNEDGFYGLRYSELVVPLVKAIQEQQQMINELKKQNADLLKRVVEFEKK